MFRKKRFLPIICLEKTLQTIVRSILDYGDVLYDKCLKFESEFLEKGQRRAANLPTGAFKITRHQDLLNELGLSPLHIRRKLHMLTLFYKIKNKQCPNYLFDSCPLVNHNTENYNFRRKDFVLPLYTRTVKYQSSYFPATIRDWNIPPSFIKDSNSLNNFKELVCQQLNEFNTEKIYSKGFGLGKINHTRVRLGLSGLNEHLYSYNLIPSRLCKRCSHSKPETSEHHFLYCDKYDELRKTRFHKNTSLVCPNVNLNSFEK